MELLEGVSWKMEETSAVAQTWSICRRGHQFVTQSPCPGTPPLLLLQLHTHTFLEAGLDPPNLLSTNWTVLSKANTSLWSLGCALPGDPLQRLATGGPWAAWDYHLLCGGKLMCDEWVSNEAVSVECRGKSLAIQLTD